MSPHGDLFHRLLDESSALLASPERAGIAIPDDELHREIIVPLLPAMLGDKAIRQHWAEQAATGFPARLARHLDGGESAARWLPGDFEIHVTASYSAGADARALADTLLSEESLRDMTATLMNRLLDALWPSLAPRPGAAPAEPPLAIEISAADISAPEIAAPAEAPTAETIPAPVIPAETEPEPAVPAEPVELIEATEPIVASEPEAVSALSVEIADESSSFASEPEHAAKIQTVPQTPPSRALVRALCRKLGASAAQRGMAANCSRAANAAVVARRILQRAESATSARRPTSPRRLPHRASL